MLNSVKYEKYWIKKTKNIISTKSQVHYHRKIGIHTHNVTSAIQGVFCTSFKRTEKEAYYSLLPPDTFRFSQFEINGT